MKKLSLIIPVLNGAKILPKTLRWLEDFFKGRDYLDEIIFIDDGSQDQTGRMIVNFSGRSTIKIRLLENPFNLGKGGSIRKGVEAVRRGVDFIFYSDDDIPFGLEPLEEMYRRLVADPTLDLVIGDRTLLKQTNPYQLHRRIGGFIYGLLMPPAIADYPDVHAGLRGFRAEAARKIFRTIKNNRWAFDPEVVLIAVINKFKIVKLPVKYVEGIKGTAFKLEMMFNVGWEITRIWLNHWFGNYAIK